MSRREVTQAGNAPTAEPYRGGPCQPFPSTPPLREQTNLSFGEVERRTDGFAPDRRVYPYVVATVKMGNDGRFCQTGGSPNLQGGIVSLCDCKHYMRSAQYFRERDGVWIAGLTGGEVAVRRRYLFFLMLARPVRSHAEMWATLSEEARYAKSAKRHRHGDVYEPLREDLDGEEAFNPDKYVEPVGNVHWPTEWRHDIAQSYRGRRPVLLLGDPSTTFIWSSPQVWLSEDAGRLPRSPRASGNIADFLSRLREGAA